MQEYSINNLIQISIDLSVEKNINLLLERILMEAMDITSCDAGTVYTCGDNCLVFQNMITRSKNIQLRQDLGEIKLPPVPLNRRHVAACCALDHKKINIADVYESSEYDFSGAQKYDQLNDYRTGSMLVIPMADEKGTVIGVLQLINAQDAEGKIRAFPSESETLIYALASLAAVSLNNRLLSQEILDILHSFVRVMVVAIEARTPYNANHTKNMVRYTTGFIDYLSRTNNSWQVSEDETDAYLMSVWLHDIGKLVIPLHIMDKSSRLGELEGGLMHRIEIALLMEKVRSLENPSLREEAAAASRYLKEARDFIQRINTSAFLTDNDLQRVQELSTAACLSSDGSRIPLLRPEETEALSIRRGTLTSEERHVIESHVTYTSKMLSSMKFSRIYEKVPRWASSHHEYLDGSGYPDHLKAEDLSNEERFLTIVDIFDALTAEDRPYKPPISPDKAFVILEKMRDEGKIDGHILSLFKESEVWIKHQIAE